MRGIKVSLLSVLAAALFIAPSVDAAFSTVSLSGGTKSGGDGKRPNIIYMMLDDVHLGRFRNLGSPYNVDIPVPSSTLSEAHRLDFPSETPVMNSIMANGINYTGMWSGTACANTRKMLLSGGINAGFLPDDTGQVSNYPLQGVPLSTSKANAAQNSLSPVSRIKSVHPEYKYFASGKCTLGVGNVDSAGIPAIDWYVYRGSRGDAWSRTPKGGCNFAFNSDEEGPGNYVNYSDGTTHTTISLDTVNYPPSSHPNIWYPPSGADGYANEPVAYAEGYIALLEDKIYKQGGVAISAMTADPWIIGWSANAVHGSDGWQNGASLINGHPMQDIIDWPANASLPENLVMSDGVAPSELPIACPGFPNSTIASKDHYELITVTSACANRYLENNDLALGILLNSLDPKVLRNTYVIFTGDNPSQENPNPDSGYASNFVFDTRVLMALSGPLVGTTPSGYCNYTWGPNANSGVEVTNLMNCGKGHWPPRWPSDFEVPFIIGYGGIPRNLRGQTSLARMRTPDITETIVSMATHGAYAATRVQAVDGHDISVTWGKGCTNPADFTSDCHQINTGVVNVGTYDAAITSTDCIADVAELDPNAQGEVYRLVRSECRGDYLQNVASATPFTDLRPIAGDGTADGTRALAGWEGLIDLLDERALPGMGLSSGGQTPTNAGPNTGEGPIAP